MSDCSLFEDVLFKSFEASIFTAFKLIAEPLVIGFDIIFGKPEVFLQIWEEFCGLQLSLVDIKLAQER